MKAWIVLLVGCLALLIGCDGDSDAPLAAPPSVADQVGSKPAVKVPIDSGSDDIDAVQVFEPSGRRVSGIVLGPDESPVEGASVTLFEVLSPWPHSRLRRIDGAFSSAAGEFRFFAPEGLDLVVEVVADRLALRRVNVPVEVDSVTIHMTHGYLLTGFVRDSVASVARGCEVFLEPSYLEDSPARSTVTDDSGRFWFDHVPPGKRRVTARTDLFRPVSAMVTVGSSGPIQLRLTQSAIQSTGRVIDASNGRPVDGAEVRAYPGAWNGRLYVPSVAVTDSDGEFVLPGLGETNLNFEIHHPDYSVARRGVSVKGRRNKIEFELSPLANLTGRVVGVQAAGIALRISTDAGEFVRSVTDEQGRFRFDDLSLGHAELEIERGRFEFKESASRLMPVSIEEVENDIEFELAAPSIVRGRVVDESGQPVSGVTVGTPRVFARHFERTLGATDRDGRFELSGLRHGSLDLKFHHDAYAEASTTVQVAASNEVVEVDDVVMPRAGRLHGLVLRDGFPAVGVSVHAGRPRQSVTTVTGPDGRYVFRGLEPGNYRVKARFSTMPFVVHRDVVTVAAGESTEVEDFNLQGGRRITGVVVDQNNNGISGARVFVPSSLSTTYTDDAGKFELDIAPDVESLQVWSPDESVNVTKSARRRHVRVRLDIVPRRTIKARVLGLPARKPVTRGVVRITADREDPTWEPSIADQRDIPSMPVELVNGVLLVEVPIGRSRIELCCQGFAPHVMNIDLDADPSRPKDLGTIVLEPGAKLRGRVVNVAGRPIPGAVVFLGREVDLFTREFRPAVMSDSDGAFELRGVSPGNRDLIVASEGRSTAIYQVRIPGDLISQDPVSIELQPASEIEVQILDANGEPSDHGIVRLIKDDTVLDVGYPDTAGLARFTAPSAGEYVVELFGEAVSTDVFVSPRPDRKRVVLERSE